LHGERRLIAVPNTAQSHDNAVADQLIVSIANDGGEVLDPGSGPSGRCHSQTDHKNENLDTPEHAVSEGVDDVVDPCEPALALGV